MIHWYQHLYTDETVNSKVSRAKKNVERCLGSLKRSIQIWKKSYYIIILAANPDNLFEIIETRQLFFKHYKKTELYVVALTKDKESAIEQLQVIIRDMWRDNPQMRVRDYFVEEDFD